MLCCAVLCHAVLCYAVLCYAPCSAMLGCAALRSADVLLIAYFCFLAVSMLLTVPLFCLLATVRPCAVICCAALVCCAVLCCAAAVLCNVFRPFAVVVVLVLLLLALLCSTLVLFCCQNALHSYILFFWCRWYHFAFAALRFFGNT